ncbi:hypothetical protein [Acinetobacter sp. TSRC1-2]|uniref:hypothetical protein n=1 Tax=unclassified Acinetobacter TaxID=196816 RepID=UPI003CFA6F2B
MNKYLFIIVLIILYPMCSQNLFAKEQCNKNQTTNLSIFKKNDYNLYNYMCYSDKGVYLKTYIGNAQKTIFLNEYADFAAKDNPKLLAVSIYKSKIKKAPVLITLNAAYHCCTPQMEGYVYTVNLYQINPNNHISLKNITNILGENSEGFEGESEGRVYYKYKDIASIKKWLEKNYK